MEAVAVRLMDWGPPLTGSNRVKEILKLNFLLITYLIDTLGSVVLLANTFDMYI